MANTSRRNRKASRYIGTFSLHGDGDVVGDLKLRGSGTLLTLHSDNPLTHIQPNACITGTSYTGDCLTLVDCHSPGMGKTSFPDAPTKYHAEVFPHYVAVGRRHFDPNEHCVSGIHFSTTDLTTIFYDFDAFSTLVDARPVIDNILRERRELRPIAAGDDAIVQYFTGKTCIADVETVAGRVSVHHRPRYSFGGPQGVYIKNRIVVSLEPRDPVTFSETIDGMYDLICFLSMAAGRAQGVKHIHITTTELIDSVRLSLLIHPSYRPKTNGKDEQHRPHPADLPLDPVQNPAHFGSVLSDWIRRQSTWRMARARYLDCLRKSNRYGPERLIAAANMFDILPADAVPLTPNLSDGLAELKEKCIAMFRDLPVSLDRNSALSALGRLGKPSLPKKVAHRTSIIESNFRNSFPDLQLVVSIAIKCRNYFVHGSADDIDYPRLAPFLPFLTDALEFVFSASDFIDAGWDARGYRGGGWGHNFTRFGSHYNSAVSELKKLLAV